jgi:ABC-type proline/glycine betaine transport system permease subunit
MFQSIPPLIFLMIIGLMAWQLAGRKIRIYSIAALTLIGFVGAWKEAMVTLSLVVTAVAFCVAGMSGDWRHCPVKSFFFCQSCSV